jgi:hypothetical protein
MSELHGFEQAAWTKTYNWGMYLKHGHGHVQSLVLGRWRRIFKPSEIIFVRS